MPYDVMPFDIPLAKRRLPWDFVKDISLRSSEIAEEKQTSEADGLILNQLKSHANGLCDSNAREDDERILGGIQTVLQQQFDLTPSVREKLAKRIEPLASRLTIQTDANANINNPVGRIMVMTAAVKFSTDLFAGEDKPTWASENDKNFSFFQQEMKIFDEGHRRRVRNIAILLEAENLLHLPLRTKEFQEGFRACDFHLGHETGAFGTFEPPFLTVPHQPNVRLSDLRTVYGQDFCLPGQLGKIISWYEEEWKQPEVFDCVRADLRRFENAIEAFEDISLAVDYIFCHAMELVDLKGRIFQAAESLKTPRQINNDPKNKRKKKEKKKVSKSLEKKTPNNGLTKETSNKGPADASPDVIGCLAKERPQPMMVVLSPGPTRRIVTSILHTGECSFTTMLDNSMLAVKLQNIDQATFPDLRSTTAYHIKRHANGMLAEKYIDSGISLLKKHWAGAVCRRKPPRKKTGRDEDDWARLIICPEGTGLFHLRKDQIIWYHPPPHVINNPDNY